MNTRPCPERGSDCKYRMPYTKPSRQQNALRFEIFYPSDRCGFAIKDNRMGGHVDDYEVCSKK